MSCSVQIKSRNTVKMKKVNNVVHRTTSETLRLSEPEVLMNNTSRQALSAISPPILKKSSCSFQITGVSLTQRTDLGDDSADDLDESHTDDISRVTDNETPSFSEDTCSRDTEDNIIDTCSALCSVTVIPTVPEFELENILSAKTSFITTAEFSETSIDHLTFIGDMASNPPTTTKNQRFPGTRFTVVKIETGIPVQRGRWECLDYIDNSVYTPKHALTYNSSTTNDLSSTNTQPHYTMTPTTPTSKPMQSNFAVLGTNYIDTVNQLLQSLSPPIPGVTQVISTSALQSTMLRSSATPQFPLSSPHANQQLSPVSAIPPSLSSPIQQDYTAILSNLINAQLRNTTMAQQTTTQSLMNPELPMQTLNQTSTTLQGSIDSFQTQPSIYSTPIHGSKSEMQIQPQHLIQSLYSSPTLPVTTVNISTSLGSPTEIQKGSAVGYLHQPVYSINPQMSLPSSIPSLSSAYMDRNVQLQTTVYSTTHNQILIQRQIQQQIYSSPTQGLPSVYSSQPSNNLALSNYSAGPPQTSYSAQSQPLTYTLPAQGSVSVTQSQLCNYSIQCTVQNQSSQLYSLQTPALSTQPTSHPTPYSVQSQASVDYITQAKQIILQLQKQSQIQTTTYSTTLAVNLVSQNSSQTSLPSMGQSFSYLQQSQVPILATTYSTPQIQRQISAPPLLSNQSSTYLPQNLNTNYSSGGSIITSTTDLTSQLSNQPQVPNQSTSFESIPTQTAVTMLPSQGSTNYLFQNSASNQNYFPVTQNPPSNYVPQSVTYQAANSVSYVSQTSSLPNQTGYYASSTQSPATTGYPLQSASQENEHFRQSQADQYYNSYFSRPLNRDPFSEPHLSTQLRNYSSNVDNISETSCSVIQLHRQGQPASYLALPQDHGSYVLHHVPSLSLPLPRRSVSLPQSRLHTQTSVHTYLPHTEKATSGYIHQPGPAHNLTHQVPTQKRRLVGQTLNISLEPENQSGDLDSRSSVFSFHNRALCSTYSKTKDISKSKVPQRTNLLPHDSTTVTASIMKPIVIGSVSSQKAFDKSGSEKNFLDKLRILEISQSSTSVGVENLEQVSEAGASSSQIAVMEVKP